MNNREDWNQWDYIKAASAAGWSDSNATEPLRVTVRDAICFLVKECDWQPQREIEWNAIKGGSK